MTTRLAVIGGDPAAERVSAALSTAGADVVAVPSGTDEVAAALTGVDAVLSFALPSLARRVAAETAPLLGAGVVYADLSPGTPGSKRAIAELFGADAYADATVDDRAEGPRFTASGPAAARLAAVLSGLGLDAEAISARTGDAVARHLLAALIEKELSAVVVDVLWAAQGLGQQAWASAELLRRFDGLSAASVREFVADLAQNRKRRQMEMMDVTEMLGETGYTSTLADGVALTYSRLLHSVKIPFADRP